MKSRAAQFQGDGTELPGTVGSWVTITRDLLERPKLQALWVRDQMLDALDVLVSQLSALAALAVPLTIVYKRTLLHPRSKMLPVIMTPNLPLSTHVDYPVLSKN